MNKERLEHTEALIRPLAPEKLRMSQWICNAAACAVGTAAQDPWHMQEGLMLAAAGGEVTPSYDGELGFNAVEVFYDLQWSDAHHLFAASEYRDDAGDAKEPAPTEVADRIRAYIDAHS